MLMRRLVVCVGGGIGMEEPGITRGFSAAVSRPRCCRLLLLLLPLLLFVCSQRRLLRLLLCCHLCKGGLKHGSRRRHDERWWGARRRGQRLPSCGSGCCIWGGHAACWAGCWAWRLLLLLHGAWHGLGQLAQAGSRARGGAAPGRPHR